MAAQVTAQGWAVNAAFTALKTPSSIRFNLPPNPSSAGVPRTVTYKYTVKAHLKLFKYGISLFLKDQHLFKKIYAYFMRMRHVPKPDQILLFLLRCPRRGSVSPHPT